MELRWARIKYGCTLDVIDRVEKETYKCVWKFKNFWKILIRLEELGFGYIIQLERIFDHD